MPSAGKRSNKLLVWLNEDLPCKCNVLDSGDGYDGREGSEKDQQISEANFHALLL